VTGVRGIAHHTLATPARLTVQPITVALAALLVHGHPGRRDRARHEGRDDRAGATKSVRVTPSAPLTAGDIQRSQPPGVNGPGAGP